MTVSRHIVVFTLRDGDRRPAEVLQRLRDARPRDTLDWRLERSENDREGTVVVQNTLVHDRAGFAAFRASPAHDALTRTMSGLADSVVVDYEE